MKITNDLFQQHVNVLANSQGFQDAGMQPVTAHLVHMSLGLSGEAGELLDAVKKHIAYQQPLDRENVIEELGDALFYVYGLAHAINISIDDVMAHNVVKLSKRYPKGFTYEAATIRADKLTNTKEA